MKSILKDSSIFKSEIREKRSYLILSTFFYITAILVIKNIANKYYFYDVGIKTLLPKVRLATREDLFNDPYFYFGILSLVTYAFWIKSLVSGIEDYSKIKAWYTTLDAALLNNLEEESKSMNGITIFKEGGYIKNLPEPFVSKDIIPFNIKGKTYGEALNDLYLVFQVMGFAENPEDNVSYNMMVNVIDRSNDNKVVYKVLYFDDQILFLSKHLDISYDLKIENLIELTYSSEEQLFGNMLAAINAIRFGDDFDFDDFPGLVTVSHLILSQVSSTTEKNEVLISEKKLNEIENDIKKQFKSNKDVDKE